ncbi:unnamed protein product [Closterium sp. NIES-54]
MLHMWARLEQQPTWQHVAHHRSQQAPKREEGSAGTRDGGEEGGTSGGDVEDTEEEEEGERVVETWGLPVLEETLARVILLGISSPGPGQDAAMQMLLHLLVRAATVPSLWAGRLVVSGPQLSAAIFKLASVVLPRPLLALHPPPPKLLTARRFWQACCAAVLITALSASPPSPPPPPASLHPSSTPLIKPSSSGGGNACFSSCHSPTVQRMLEALFMHHVPSV